MQRKNAVGRFIARPFSGSEGNYTRTTNRRDHSLSTSETTMLDEIKSLGGEVIAIGKIEDIFNKKEITKAVYTKGNLNGKVNQTSQK
jgi:phosphopentomutase